MLKYWNYRVIKDKWFAIHEVYYTEDEQPSAYSESEVSPWGETLEELEEDMEHFKQALLRPVLDIEELDEQCRKNKSDLDEEV